MIRFKNNNSKTTILFLHGLACDSTYFSDMLLLLGKDYNFVLPELFGHYEKSKNTFTLEEESDLIIDFCKINNTKIDYVVAHSMSSILAFIVDSKVDTIKKIFLLEGNIIPEDFKWSSQLAEMNNIEFKHYWEKFQKQYPLILKMTLKKRIDLKKYTENIKLLNGIGIHHYANLITVYENKMQEFTTSFRKVKYLESESSKFLQKKEKLFQNDNLKLHVVSNASHYLMLDNPNSVIEILKEEILCPLVQ